MNPTKFLKDFLEKLVSILGFVALAAISSAIFPPHSRALPKRQNEECHTSTPYRGNAPKRRLVDRSITNQQISSLVPLPADETEKDEVFGAIVESALLAEQAGASNAPQTPITETKTDSISPSPVLSPNTGRRLYLGNSLEPESGENSEDYRERLDDPAYRNSDGNPISTCGGSLTLSGKHYLDTNKTPMSKVTKGEGEDVTESTELANKAGPSNTVETPETKKKK